MVGFVASGSRHGGGALRVGNVADRAAAGLGRPGQSDRRRERELESLRQNVHRGRTFGRQDRQKPITKRLGLESAYRPSGRPPKMGRRPARKPVTRLNSQDLSCILASWLLCRFCPWPALLPLFLGAAKLPILPTPDPSRFSDPRASGCRLLRGRSVDVAVHAL
jgi:hypothetical protein